MLHPGFVHILTSLHLYVFQMNTKLSHLPLRPSTLSTLTRRGFNSTADVQSSRSSGISIFAAELEVSLIEAAGIGREIDQAIRYILGEEGGSQSQNQGMETETFTDTNHNTSISGTSMNHVRVGGETAASILSAHYQQQKSTSSSNSKYISRPIITFAKSIDTLTGGGIQPREVTEIAGSPGTGKTQLAMQLCVDVTLPKAFGGVDGSSIYIDSEGSFSPERCHDMAHALVQHVHNSARRKQRSSSNSGGGGSGGGSNSVVPESFTTEEILDSIHVFRVYDETTQTATITSIPDFLDAMMERNVQKNPVKLLIVDSIAFHYRVSQYHYVGTFMSMFI